MRADRALDNAGDSGRTHFHATLAEMNATRDSRAPVSRVGIVFSGGPAPGANAVISSATSALRRAGVEVVGLLYGYSRILDYDGDPGSLREGVTHHVITDRDLWGLRHRRGISLGTARAHPGREIRNADDLADPERTAGLHRVYAALTALGLDALISIGGDGTLRTASLLHRYQQALPADAPRVRVLHVPKTVDNDYDGIDFTFGFFTAVDVMAKELLNLRADAIATQSYFVVTTMGRRAGWLAYGVAVAGEAHLVIGVEDVDDSLRDPGGHLDLPALVERIVDLVATRARSGKEYGVVVLSEGLSGLLPPEALDDAGRDAYGHVSFSTLHLSRLVATRVAERFEAREGRACSVRGVQLGYEARSAEPHAFDVLLGTQLGQGAYRALCEAQLDAHMVSVTGQLQLRYIPFDTLVDPVTLVTPTRMVEVDSDYHRLAHALGTRLPGAGGGGGR